MVLEVSVTGAKQKLEFDCRTHPPYNLKVSSSRDKDLTLQKLRKNIPLLLERQQLEKQVCDLVKQISQLKSVTAIVSVSERHQDKLPIYEQGLVQLEQLRHQAKENIYALDSYLREVLIAARIEAISEKVFVDLPDPLALYEQSQVYKKAYQRVKHDIDALTSL